MFKAQILSRGCRGNVDHTLFYYIPLLNQTKIIDEISPRSRDIIVGMGERLSCTIIAAVLKDKVRNTQEFSCEVTKDV